MTFFRSMGGTLGASALGAVLTARLMVELPRYLPRTPATNGGDNVAQVIQSPQAVNALKQTNPALHEGIIQAYSHAIDTMFLVAVPISILSVVAALFIRQVQLRDSPAASPVTDEQPVTAEADGVR